MTKPTGRPKGRPRGPEYLTLTARMPLELVDQIRRYAARKRQPLSEVLRDGIQILLEQEETAPRYVYDRNTSPAKVSDTKEDTPPTLEAPQARQPYKLSDTKEAPFPLDTPQPIIVSDVKDDGLPVETPSAKVSDAKEAGTVPSFDTTKYRLGKLCPRGHDYEGTGQSLRAKNRAGYCIACNVQQQHTRRAKRQALGWLDLP